MEAVVTKPAPRDPGNPLARRLWFAIGGALAASLTAVAVILVLRRVSGAMARPASGWVLLTTAALLPAATWMVRWSVGPGRFSREPSHGARPPRGSAGLLLVPTVAAGLWLLAISTPASGMLALGGAWLVWLTGETAAWWGWRKAAAFSQVRTVLRAGREGSSPSRKDGSSDGRVRQEVCDGEAARRDQADEVLTEVPPNLVQQMTRLIEEGNEQILILARVVLAPNDRVGVLHVAFCPPLAQPPELTACVLDTSSAEVRITQVETFGARVEVRLPQPAPQEQVLWLEIHGTAPASSLHEDEQP